MRYFKLIFLFCALLFSTSCNFILKRIYGIKNPKVESEKSILKFARKKHFDKENIVTLPAKAFVKTFQTGVSIPDADVFDGDGNYIEYRRTDTSCNAGLFEFIPSLRKGGVYNKTGKKELKKEIEKFRDLKGNEITPVSSADFFILVYWTVWTGKLNKDHVRPWEELAKANKNANIKVYLVNLDFQKYWDKEERKKIMDAMKKKK